MKLSDSYIEQHIDRELLEKAVEIERVRHCEQKIVKIDHVTPRVQFKVPFYNAKITTSPIYILFQPLSWPRSELGEMTTMHDLKQFGGGDIQLSPDEWLNRLSHTSLYLPDTQQVQVPGSKRFADASMFKSDARHAANLRSLPHLLSEGGKLRFTNLDVYGLTRAVAYVGPAGKCFNSIVNPKS